MLNCMFPFKVRYTTGNAREETLDCQNQVRQKKKLLTCAFISIAVPGTKVCRKNYICKYFLRKLNQLHSVSFAGGAHIVGPDAALDFADVPLAQQEHAQAALSDAATNALRQFTCEQAAVEIKIGAVLLAADFELPVQRLRIYADTH